MGELRIGVGLVADGELPLGLVVAEEAAGVVGAALVRAGFGLAGRPGATR